MAVIAGALTVATDQAVAVAAGVDTLVTDCRFAVSAAIAVFRVRRVSAVVAPDSIPVVNREVGTRRVVSAQDLLNDLKEVQHPTLR